MAVKLGEYKDFYWFIKERVEEVNDFNIEIVKGNRFSVVDLFLGNYEIQTVERVNSETHSFMLKYFKDKLNSIHWIISNYSEYFALLHEIGHILNRDSWMNPEEKKQVLLSKEYNSNYEAFVAYRELEEERLADNFAIEFTNKYFYEICKFFTGMNKEKVDEFISIFK